ncbi:MAG: His/Gly/Thr/Pro-type tRNA ligase C-terminal domain-containing protein, partial [Brevefilum sp.]
ESLRIAAEIRSAGFRVVVYPEAEKLGKQFKFADKLDIMMAIIAGPDELETGKVAVKNLKTREQVTVERQALVDQIAEFLPSPS